MVVLASMEDVALSVSISPLLPSSLDDDEDPQNAGNPANEAAHKRVVHFEPFQPTHTVFTPKLTDTAALRYRRPDDRVVGSTSLAPPTSVSSIVHPNYDDFLRRVSVVLYQHVRRCEKRHRAAASASASGSTSQAVAASIISSAVSNSSASGSGSGSGYRPNTGNGVGNGNGNGNGTRSVKVPTIATAVPDTRQLEAVEESPSAPIPETSTSANPNGEDNADGRPRTLTDSVTSSLGADVPVDELFREKYFVTPQYKYTFVRVPLVHPLTCYMMEKVTSKCHVPSVDEIFRFCKNLFNKAQLSAECTIVCLIYIERLMEQASVPLLAETWKPIVLCGLLLASKVWQDLSSWNVEISNIYPQFPLHSINRLERLFLHHIQWDLYISGSVYAKYYFALRSLTEKKDFRRRYNYTMRVDPPNSKRLEERSAAIRHELYSKSL